MDLLLLFFAIPLAVIILSIVLQKILKCPWLVAATFFAIFLIVTFAVGDIRLLIFTVVYTIISYITALILIIGGIFFIANPTSTTYTVIHTIGILFIVIGIINILTSIIRKYDILLPGNYLVNGITSLIVGLILSINPESTIKIFATILGVWLLFNGITYLAFSINNNESLTSTSSIKNIIKIFLGIIILFTPIVTVLFTSYIIGTLLVISGIYMIVDIKKNEKVYKVRVK